MTPIASRLTEFLRGGSPAARPNGETELGPVPWSTLSNFIGSPERPFADLAQRLLEDAWTQYEGNRALAQRAVVEAYGEHELLPADWCAAHERRLFMYATTKGAAEDDLATMEYGISLARALGALGASVLGTAEALALEALHAHWDPSMRRAPLLWEAAEHSLAVDDNDVFLWMHQWDDDEEAAAEVAEELRVIGALGGAFRADLAKAIQVVGGRPRRVPNAAAKERQTVAVANGRLEGTFLSLAARWTRQGREVPRTLLWQRLWAAAFLDHAHTYKVPARTPINGGPTRDALRALYAPMLSLCQLGIIPGSLTPTGFRLLVIEPDPDDVDEGGPAWGAP